MSTDVRADTLMGAALAQFTIHIGPVPITGQSFAVLLTGALLGSRLGTAAVIAYLIEGAVGLPFFAAGGSGIARFFGSTGGYLVGFPAAAFVTGAFAEHGWDRRYYSAVIAMAIGSAIILLSGWAWYSIVTNTPPHVSFMLAVGRFLPGDVIKIALA